MFFLIIIGLFFLAIVFFHYLQGFFSATLSAIIAVFSSVLAFSYHESIVEGLLGGKIADYANALVLLSLFAILYLVLRTAFDNLVPGDVRVQALANKIGAAVMGVIAAVFATGILAIAAQELPFGPSIAGYARYDVLDDRPNIPVPVSGRAVDRTIYAELNFNDPGKFGTDGSSHGVPLLPVDNIVVGAVEKFSNGLLSDGKPLDTVHSAFLDELFGQRMGIEAGANHVAVNNPDKNLDAMDVVGLYSRTIPDANQKDADYAKVRTGGAIKPKPLKPNLKFLVIRVKFKAQAADQKDRTLRFSPGSVRLVVPSSNPDGPPMENIYPVGTLQDAQTLYLNKADDFLFQSVSQDDAGVDLVFEVNKKQFDSKAPAGTFIEFKRLARVDLGNQEIKIGPKQDPAYNPLRKQGLMPEKSTADNTPAPTPIQPTPTPPTPIPTPTPTPIPPTSPNFQVASAVASDVLPVPITAPAGQEGTIVRVPGIEDSTAVIAAMKLKRAVINSTASEQTLSQKITQFSLPPGQVMVQVNGTPASAAPWGFATEPDQYELVDSGGKRYQPNGTFARFNSAGSDRFYLRYDDTQSISGAATPPDGTVKQITFLYVVPNGTTATEFDDHGKKAGDANVTAK